MRECTICGRISGTDEDHLDCIEKRRIELEDEEPKGGIPDMDEDMAREIRAILKHMTGNW